MTLELRKPETGDAKEIRDYYHCILPFFEAELRGRGDEGFWAQMASQPPDCRVLEIGAGTGRATVFLAQTAGRVVASDLSLELMAVARRRLAELSHVHLLVADLRELRLQEQFDLVAAIDDPLIHLTDDEDRNRAFAVAAEHLAPGGRFVLDAAWFPPEDRYDAATGMVRERVAEDGHLHVREIWCCDPDTRLCTARFEYRLRGRLATEASFPGRLWSVGEIEARARTANLELSQLWGDYDFRAWDRSSSPRLIAEMRKP